MKRSVDVNSNEVSVKKPRSVSTGTLQNSAIRFLRGDYTVKYIDYKEMTNVVNNMFHHWICSMRQKRLSKGGKEVGFYYDFDLNQDHSEDMGMHDSECEILSYLEHVLTKTEISDENLSLSDDILSRYTNKEHYDEMTYLEFHHALFRKLRELY